MRLSQPIGAIERIVVDRHLSPQAQGRLVASAARRIITDVSAHNAKVLGRMPEREVFVDGRKGAPLEAVNLPNGTISVEFRLVTEVVVWVRDMLREQAPVLTGKFRASILLFADGHEISPDGEIPLAEEYEFLSDQPYARRLERGSSKQAPDGVFEAVSVLAHRRFGNIANVGFNYRALPSGAVGAWAVKPSARKLARNIRGGQERLHTEWLTRQPTVWIQPR